MDDRTERERSFSPLTIQKSANGGIMNDKIKETLNGILELFKTGDIPQAISFATFPPFNIPASKWSFLNNLVLWIHKTNDARGYKQWGQVGRHVKKGSKAIHILAPRLKKEKNGEGEDEARLIGFLGIPVFKAEDTEGDPLNYETAIPEFSLMEKAKAWGLPVKAVEGNGRYWGAYNGSEIKLATPEECVFLHELSHHAHKLIKGQLTPGQDWKQEIVAELSAEAIGRLVGRKTDTTGNSYRYIDNYAKEANLNPVTACLQVLHEVEQVIKLIMGKEASHDATNGIEAGLLEAS
jgi:hypothetical protein